MIGKVRRRDDFARFAREGQRTRVGALTVVHAAGRRTPPGVGYAVGRSVGPAVARNRRRRQLRHLCNDLYRHRPELFGAGHYLLALAPTDAPYHVLEQWLIEALQMLSPAPGPPAPCCD